MFIFELDEYLLLNKYLLLIDILIADIADIP